MRIVGTPLSRHGIVSGKGRTVSMAKTGGNRSARLAVTAIFLSFSSALFAAGVPVEDMSLSTIGIEYSGTMAGQSITGAKVNSVFKAHYLMLRYAPLPWLLISAGAGVTNYSTEEYDSARFSNTPGASAAFGIHGFTPRLFNVLMITAGVQACLLNSSQGWYRYTAVVADPGAGIIFIIADQFDIEAGAKAHLLSGRKEATFQTADFSNGNPLRGYLSLTLHSRGGGAYASCCADFSPQAGLGWSHGPEEASLSIRVGTILRPFKDRASSYENEKKVVSRADYDTMKQQQKKMADDFKKRK